MELRHTFTVPLTIDDAWEAFNDLGRIAPCFPGAVVTAIEGDSFSGTAKVKVGPVALQYEGTGKYAERDRAAYRAVIEAAGRDKRGNGTAAATVTALLESAGEAATRVVVDTDLRITGRPAQFGRGVIQDVGSRLLDQFAACLAEKLTGPEAAPAAAEPVRAAAEPASAAAEPAPAATAPAPPPPAGATLAEAPAAAAAAPPPTAAEPQPAGRERRATQPEVEVQLGSVVGSVLVKRYGPTLLACLVTAVVTWLVARRRR